MGISLYIHIPFCTTKCRYCDFISYPAGKSHKFSEYIFALGREMELLSRQYGQIDVDTVYLGGGTPSLLPETHIKDILARINSFFLLAKSAEITIEANPETLDKEKLATYRSLGINRLSIGAQTAANDLLADMGRGHSWTDVINVTVWAREAGFTNIGLDLIYGLPGQSLTQWRKTLVQAADIRPQHLSVYG